MHIQQNTHLEPDVERPGEEDAGGDGELLDGYHQAPHLLGLALVFHVWSKAMGSGWMVGRRIDGCIFGIWGTNTGPIHIIKQSQTRIAW